MVFSEDSYCTLQDVKDIVPSDVIGDNDGQISEAKVLRLILKSTGVIEEWNGDRPFIETEDLEYIELCGLDRIMTRGYPIITVTKLEVQETDDSWTELEQGRDDNSDDYFVESERSGLIRFHNVPTESWCRVTYTYGYETLPYWLRDLCSKMVAKDMFRLKPFDENCDNLFRYWMDEVKSLGARWATTAKSELEIIREKAWMR